MKKPIAALSVVVLLLILLFYFSINYFVSPDFPTLSPTQTSIFTGAVGPELIRTLMATQTNGRISQEQAIGLAELYCASVHSLPKQNPTNIEANLLTESEARLRLNNEDIVSSSTPVWLVSMDGSWEHFPPPSSSNETPIPLIFSHCNVIINAQSGEMMVVTN